MNQLKDLLSIGAFASMTRLSIKALRLYDQLGILQPRHIDSQSGYRYYGIDQLSSARMIRSMREMDMPLATIRRVLASLAAHPNTPAEAEALVNDYVASRARQVEQIRGRVHYFIQLLQQENNPMTLEVNVKKIEPQQVLSLTHHIKVDKLDFTIRKSLETLYGIARQQNAEASDPPFGIYHGAINEQDDGPIEICLPVSGQVKAKGEAQTKQLAGGNAACVIMHGAQCDFPDILKGYDAAVDWIQKNGYETAEPPREIWHGGPTQEARMEIVWLFK